MVCSRGYPPEHRPQLRRARGTAFPGIVTAQLFRRYRCETKRKACRPGERDVRILAGPVPAPVARSRRGALGFAHRFAWEHSVQQHEAHPASSLAAAAARCVPGRAGTRARTDILSCDRDELGPRRKPATTAMRESPSTSTTKNHRRQKAHDLSGRCRHPPSKDAGRDSARRRYLTRQAIEPALHASRRARVPRAAAPNLPRARLVSPRPVPDELGPRSLQRPDAQ
jgi:hypothetical protein